MKVRISYFIRNKSSQITDKIKNESISGASVVEKDPKLSPSKRFKLSLLDPICSSQEFTKSKLNSNEKEQQQISSPRWINHNSADYITQSKMQARFSANNDIDISMESYAIIT